MVPMKCKLCTHPDIAGQQALYLTLSFDPKLMAQALRQVWWYSMVLMKGKMCTHDLASGRTVEVPAAATLPMVLCIHLDASNCIWTGHKTGLLALWTENGPSASCSPIRLESSDIMCDPGCARPAELPQRRCDCKPCPGKSKQAVELCSMPTWGLMWSPASRLTGDASDAVCTASLCPLPVLPPWA